METRLKGEAEVEAERPVRKPEMAVTWSRVIVRELHVKSSAELPDVEGLKATSQK